MSLDWIQEVWDTNGGHCVAQRGIKVLAPCASILYSFALNSSHSPHFQFNFWELRWFLVVYRGNNLCSEKAWANIGSQMQYILSTYTLDRTASQNLGILSRDCTVVHIWLLTELDLTIFMLNSAINARIGFNCNACLNSYFFCLMLITESTSRWQFSTVMHNPLQRNCIPGCFFTFYIVTLPAHLINLTHYCIIRLLANGMHVQCTICASLKCLQHQVCLDS